MRPWPIVPVLCLCVPLLLIGHTGRASANRGKICLGCKVASDSYCVSLCLNTFQLLEFSYIYVFVSLFVVNEQRHKYFKASFSLSSSELLLAFHLLDSTCVDSLLTSTLITSLIPSNIAVHPLN